MKTSLAAILCLSPLFATAQLYCECARGFGINESPCRKWYVAASSYQRWAAKNLDEIYYQFGECETRQGTVRYLRRFWMKRYNPHYFKVKVEVKDSATRVGKASVNFFATTRGEIIAIYKSGVNVLVSDPDEFTIEKVIVALRDAKNARTTEFTKMSSRTKKWQRKVFYLLPFDGESISIADLQKL